MPANLGHRLGVPDISGELTKMHMPACWDKTHSNYARKSAEYETQSEQ